MALSLACRSVRRLGTTQTLTRAFSVQATAEAGYDSRNHAFFVPTDVVHRVFFERIQELEVEVNDALKKPYTRTPEEIKEAEAYIAAERQKLGLTHKIYDTPVSPVVTGNLANLRQYTSQNK